jgi:hypothetical protein
MDIGTSKETRKPTGEYRGRVSRKGLAGTFEVFHKPPLKFDGYQFPRAKTPAAKKAIPIEILKFGCSNNAQSSAQRVRP